MRRNVGRPTIAPHKRKTRVHLSIAPYLIEEIDNNLTYSQSRSEYIVKAIKVALNQEEELVTLEDADAHACLVKLLSTGLIEWDLFMSLQEKYRERPNYYTIENRNARFKKQFDANNDE